MNQPVESLLVPASLLRIRAFLWRRGLRVPPWAEAGVVLDALHDVLRERVQDAEFWRDLDALMADLSADLQKRLAAQGSAVSNELLDSPTRHALLEEIRSVLDARDAIEPGPRFGALARSLSMPAVIALCLLGGVAVVGCGGKAVETGRESGAAAGAPSGGTSGSGGTSTGGASTSGGTGGSVATGGAGGACTNDRTLEAIIDQCVQPSSPNDPLHQCLAALNESWRAGIRDLLACASCTEVQNRAWTCIEMLCYDSSLSPSYSLNAFLDHCAVPIYTGVPID